MNSQPPIYTASEMPQEISPMHMFRNDPEIQKRFGGQSGIIQVKSPAVKEQPPKPHYDEPENLDAYKRLSDIEKDQICAAIVLSHHWRTFLKPYLEERINPTRRPVRNDEDYYTLLNDNAVAADRLSIIHDLERRARRSPSYQFIPEGEEHV